MFKQKQVFNFLNVFPFGFFMMIAVGAEAHASMGSALESSLKAMKKSVSAQVMNLSNGKMLLAVNSDQPLNPASSVKLLTAYTALQKLGVNYQFKTSFYQSKKGDFCIRGGGDPSLVMEDLYLVVEALKRKGVDEFSGKVTIDASVFDHELYPEDRNSQDSERAYNAPISGLNFNYNTVSVFVNPTSSGKSARIGLDFPFDFVKVQGKVMTGSGTNVTWDKKGKGEQEIVQLGGKIAAGSDEWRKPFRIRDPSRAFAEAFFKMMNHGGVPTKGSFRFETGSCSGDPIHVHSSRPLSFIVSLMDKYSNNFIADSLVKTIDAELNRHPGTTEGGLKLIKNEMKRFDLDLTTGGRKMVSGSGLTDDNLLSASDFIRLLKQVHQSKSIMPELFSSLPLAGVDGTLRKKYNGTDVEGLLRGKTGSLTGVQSLVGVYPSKEGDWIGVAVITNQGHSIPERELAQFLAEL
jgi:D-alanyl-D-alanine carboxypeptidase/D-alanyl-D-alanine-endopeptidase (penicillin-binding protein 4)